MKSRLIVMIFLSIITFYGKSQTSNICASVSIQGWSPSTVYTSAAGYTSLNEAKEMISNVISAVGLKQNFKVLAANIPNAAAVVYRGDRYILYNPDFISRLNAAAGNKWAAVSVLAHEVGHHLNGHTLDVEGSAPEKELEADEFSGFVLSRLGATLEQAEVAMKIAATYKSDLTHPGQQQRLTAIDAGWNNANRQVTTQNNTAQVSQLPLKKPAQTMAASAAGEQPVKINNGREQINVLADKYILKDVHFMGAEDSEYFITTRYHLVRVDNDQLYLVGNVVPVKNGDYPFVIEGADDAKLFVAAKGFIVNGTGKQVGYITAHR